MTIIEYITRTDKLLNTPFTITHTGKGYYNDNGTLYTREEFRRKYPLPVTLIGLNKVNCDHTKDFLKAD